MKAFDLEKALNRDPVVAADGEVGTFLTTTTNCGKLRYWFKFSWKSAGTTMEAVCAFDADGSPEDNVMGKLQMAPKIVTMYANVYKDLSGFQVGVLREIKTECEKTAGVRSPKYLGVATITFEI